MNTEEQELDNLMRTTAGCMQLLFPKAGFALIIRFPDGNDATLGNKGHIITKSLFRRGLSIMTDKVKEKK